MAAPANSAAAPGSGGGSGRVRLDRGVEQGDELASAKADYRKAVDGSDPARREVLKDLAAKEGIAHKGYASGSLGLEAGDAQGERSLSKQENDQAGALAEAKKLAEKPAPSAGSAGVNGPSAALVLAPAAPPPASASGELGAGGAGKAQPPAPAKPGSPSDKAAVAGNWVVQPAVIVPPGGAATREAEDSKRTAVSSVVATQRSNRIEALRHYYRGLELLNGSKTHKDYTVALAELALAHSLAPDMTVVDEAIRRANRGLDAAPGE
jgi:hypothetical protein